MYHVFCYDCYWLMFLLIDCLLLSLRRRAPFPVLLGAHGREAGLLRDPGPFRNVCGKVIVQLYCLLCVLLLYVCLLHLLSWFCLCFLGFSSAALDLQRCCSLLLIVVLLLVVAYHHRHYVSLCCCHSPLCGSPGPPQAQRLLVELRSLRLAHHDGDVVPEEIIGKEMSALYYTTEIYTPPPINVYSVYLK